MRPFVWYLAFSVAVGAALAAFLPMLVLWYAAIAVVGGLLLLADLARGRAPSRPRQFSNQMLDDFRTRRFAELDRAYAEAALVRQEPWYADAVVDMAAVVRAGHPLSEPNLIIPNPFFVLPMPKLVEWGFVGASDPLRATLWLRSSTPPVSWQNGPLVELLRLMGWDDQEAYLRIGLWLWYLDSVKPDANRAAIEADYRGQNLVFHPDRDEDPPQVAHDPRGSQAGLGT